MIATFFCSLGLVVISYFAISFLSLSTYFFIIIIYYNNLGVFIYFTGGDPWFRGRKVNFYGFLA